MKTRIFFFLFEFLCIFISCAETITFSAESMTGTAGNKNSTTVLRGNAFVRTENMEISADMIELSGKNFRRIKAYGNVTGRNSESKMEFRCESLRYDRQTEISVFEREVSLSDVENEVEAEAGLIEYDQKKETAVMQIQVKLVQKQNVCTSAYAIYRRREQTLEMSGNPKIVQNDDTFRAQVILLDMNTQEISLTGRVKGSVSTSSESSSGTAQNDDDKQDVAEEQDGKSE
ncbi:LptA/OstA family protein [Treponema sp.]|uniref:LptA/OstA family protein n=1 Tax=Treponema sp. TaxID=166 RepID=UPI003F043F55